MHNHVTVVPGDRLVIVDGIGLNFEYVAPRGLHALQWHGGKGHQEWTEVPNTTLSGEADYAAHVAPFVALWQEELTRLEAAMEAARAAAEAEYNSLDATRARRMRELETVYASVLGYMMATPESASAVEAALAVTQFQADDPDGLAYAASLLAARRAELEAAIMAADSPEAVRAITISFPV